MNKMKKKIHYCRNNSKI